MSKFRKLFKLEEWEWLLKLGASLTDPEQKKELWEAVIAKKQASSLYSLFDDFPKEETEKGTMAKKYCGEILELLKRGKRGA